MLIIILILRLYNFNDCSKIGILVNKKDIYNNFIDYKIILKDLKNINSIKMNIKEDLNKKSCNWGKFSIILDNIIYDNQENDINIDLFYNVNIINFKEKNIFYKFNITSYNDIIFFNNNLNITENFYLKGKQITINNTTIINFGKFNDESNENLTLTKNNCCINENNNIIFQYIYNKYVKNKNDIIDFNEIDSNSSKILFKNAIFGDIINFNNSNFSLYCKLIISNVLDINNSKIRSISNCDKIKNEKFKFNSYQKICGNFGGSNYSSGGIPLNFINVKNLNNKCFDLFQNNFIKQLPNKNYYFSGKWGDQRYKTNKISYNGGIIEIYSQILLIDKKTNLNVSAVNLKKEDETSSGSSSGSIKIFSQYYNIKNSFIANGSDSFSKLNGEGSGGNIIVSKYFVSEYFINSKVSLKALKDKKYNKYYKLSLNNTSDFNFQINQGKRLDFKEKFKKFSAEKGIINTSYCNGNKFGFNCLNCEKGFYSFNLTNNFCIKCYEEYSKK